MTILGTRPEIIRLAAVTKRLDAFANHVIVHTGQNWDFELNEVFFKDLDLRAPDYFLGVGGGSLGETLGAILSETEKVLKSEKPDAVLILGDTNSSIAGIIARRMKIPLYHMEAGNRSFDRNVPEETNRKIIDHIADFNLVYTEHARRHLLSEGCHHRRIYLTGSPMNEVLIAQKEKILQSKILTNLELQSGKYIVASLHREENVDDPNRLNILVQSLIELHRKFSFPVIVSTHPRTKKRLLGKYDLAAANGLRWLPPFNFSDYNHLQMNAFCVISDSGTIIEESAILGFPAVTPRDSIERPEGLDVGSAMLSPVTVDDIISGVVAATSMFKGAGVEGKRKRTPVEYMIDDTSQRVVSLILGTCKLSNSWDGIRVFDY